jgi:hypothetical protein
MPSSTIVTLARLVIPTLDRRNFYVRKPKKEMKGLLFLDPKRQ